jgi:hypothetical protein
MMVMVTQPWAAAAALDPLARMQNYTLGPKAPSPRCAAHDRRRQALARWRRAEAATPCHGPAEAHTRLEACDDGRFVGCQRSDLYDGELWLTTRRTGRLWLRGEAPVRRGYCQGLGGEIFDSHFASSKR